MITGNFVTESPLTVHVVASTEPPFEGFFTATLALHREPRKIALQSEETALIAKQESRLIDAMEESAMCRFYAENRNLTASE